MSNYTTTAATTRISSSAVVEDTHIEEQLNSVRLDGEKSPLTSPKRGGRPSKQKVSAWGENDDDDEFFFDTSAGYSDTEYCDDAFFVFAK